MQFEFLESELLPRLEEAGRGERRVFFVDAAHFVPGSFLGMIWSFARIFVPSGAGRQRYNILGAVETRDHDLVTVRNTGSVNSDTVCELLAKIDENHPGEEITLVMDNARYQRNKKVFAAAADFGIDLLFLPAYSPNLNLIERVWKLVKAKCLRKPALRRFSRIQDRDRRVHRFLGRREPEFAEKPRHREIPSVRHSENFMIWSIKSKTPSRASC